MTQVILTSGRLKGRSILHMGKRPAPEQTNLLSEAEIQDRMEKQAPPLVPVVRPRWGWK